MKNSDKTITKRNRQHNIIVSNNNAMVGSLTIEAAFIMPIVISIVFALIYLACYLHDYCRLQGIVDNTLHQAGLYLKHEADLETGELDYEEINDRGVFYILFGSAKQDEKKLLDSMRKELKKGLFLVKVKGIEVDVSKLNIMISVEGETQVTLPGVNKLFQRFDHREIKAIYSIHNPAETLRRCEVILEVGSEIRGVDKLKEIVEKFFNQGK